MLTKNVVGIDGGRIRSGHRFDRSSDSYYGRDQEGSGNGSFPRHIGMPDEEVTATWTCKEVRFSPSIQTDNGGAIIFCDKDSSYSWCYSISKSRIYFRAFHKHLLAYSIRMNIYR